MPRLFLLLALAFAALLPAPVRAQPLTGDPGYLDLSRVDGWFAQEPTVEIDLKGSLLRMVTRSAQSDDPQLAEALRQVRAVQVRVFPLAAAALGTARTRTADLARRLEAQGWESFVRVRQDRQFVNMLVRPRSPGSDALAGLVVAVVDEDDDEPQAVFINIVGDVDPERIGDIGRRFGAPRVPAPPRPPTPPRPPRRNDDE